MMMILILMMLMILIVIVLMAITVLMAHPLYTSWLAHLAHLSEESYDSYDSYDISWQQWTTMDNHVAPYWPVRCPSQVRAYACQMSNVFCRMMTINCRKPNQWILCPIHSCEFLRLMWRLPTLSMLTSFCKAWLACSPAIDPIVLFILALTSGWWPPLSICNRIAQLQLFHTTLDYFCYFIHVSPPRISASIHDFPALLWHPS